MYLTKQKLQHAIDKKIEIIRDTENVKNKILIVHSSYACHIESADEEKREKSRIDAICCIAACSAV